MEVHFFENAWYEQYTKVLLDIPLDVFSVAPNVQVRRCQGASNLKNKVQIKINKVPIIQFYTMVPARAPAGWWRVRTTRLGWHLRGGGCSSRAGAGLGPLAMINQIVIDAYSQDLYY